MNRAKLKNLLPVAVSSPAAVTETETNPFALGNLYLSIYRNLSWLLYAMPVTPDSS